MESINYFIMLAMASSYDWDLSMQYYSHTCLTLDVSDETTLQHLRN